MFTVPNNSNSSNELISINSPILNDFEMADVSTDNTTSPKTSAMEVSASTTTNTTTTDNTNQELSANNEIRGAASLILLPSPAKNDVIPAEPFYENGVHRSGGSRGCEKTSALSRKGSSSPANLIILNTPPSPTIKPYNDLLNGTQTDLLTHNQLALPSSQSTKNKTSAR